MLTRGAVRKGEGRQKFLPLAEAGSHPPGSPLPLRGSALALCLPPATSETHSRSSRNVILFHLKTFHFMSD